MSSRVTGALLVLPLFGCVDNNLKVVQYDALAVVLSAQATELQNQMAFFQLAEDGQASTSRGAQGKAAHALGRPSAGGSARSGTQASKASPRPAAQAQRSNSGHTSGNAGTRAGAGNHPARSAVAAGDVPDEQFFKPF